MPPRPRRGGRTGRRVAQYGAHAGVAAFAPTTISGLQLWVDYSDATRTFTDAGTTSVAANDDLIRQANDQSGNSRHMTQATAGSRPHWMTNVQNGKAVARYDPGSNGIGHMTSGVFAAGLAQPATEFLVVNQRIWNLASRFLDGTTTNGLVLNQYDDTPALSIYAGSAFAAENHDLVIGTFGIVSVVWNGASSNIRVNGGAGITGDPGSGGLVAGDGRRVGWTFNLSGVSLLNVDIGAHLLYDTALSTTNHNLVGNYLATAWGLTWTGVS